MKVHAFYHADKGEIKRYFKLKNQGPLLYLRKICFLLRRLVPFQFELLCLFLPVVRYKCHIYPQVLFPAGNKCVEQSFL